MRDTWKRVGLAAAGAAMAGAALVGCGEADKATDDAKTKSPAAKSTAAAGGDEELQGMAGGCARKTQFTRGGKPYLTFGHSKALKTNVSKGDKGNMVLEAQCLLAEHRCKVGQADGVFGVKTQKAVIRFQQQNRGLQVDGAIGKQTWPKLRDQVAARC